MAAALTAAAFVSTARADHIGRPTIFRFVIDDTFTDPDLTAACGFPITLHLQGSASLIIVQGQRTGLFEVENGNVLLTATAGDNTYTTRWAGPNIVRVTPDGFSISMTIGLFGFHYTGVFKEILGTGEVLLEPHHSLEGDVADACAALAA